MVLQNKFFFLSAAWTDCYKICWNCEMSSTKNIFFYPHFTSFYGNDPRESPTKKRFKSVTVLLLCSISFLCLVSDCNFNLYNLCMHHVFAFFLVIFSDGFRRATTSKRFWTRGEGTGHSWSLEERAGLCTVGLVYSVIVLPIFNIIKCNAISITEMHSQVGFEEKTSSQELKDVMACFCSLMLIESLFTFALNGNLYLSGASLNVSGMIQY